jgi:nicotinamidase-related amidase
LRGRGIRAVIVAGVAGTGCVESTVRDALELDFYVVVPRDAVGDNTPELDQATDQALARLLDGDELATAGRVRAVWAGSATSTD